MKILRRLGLGFVGLLAFLWLGMTIYAYWPSGIEEVPARELASAEDKFVAVDGMEMRYREFGTPGPNRPTLVLIHGFGNSLQSFRLLAPQLTDDYHVITVDLPGFGLSAKPAVFNYDNENQAKTMGDFIRALGLERVIIGGHSLGGAIALRVAVTEPEVRGLVLMNPGIINSGVPWIAQYYFFPLQRLSAKQMGDRDFREAMIKGSFMNPDMITDEVMDDLQLAVRSEGYLASATTMMGQYEEPDEEPLLADVRVPTLIVWGEKDRRKTPEELARLEAGLPDSRTLKVPDSGHYVQEEGADQVAEGMAAAKGYLSSG
jgi:pimeloyl-ACP methyl ester carboxylesterase